MVNISEITNAYSYDEYKKLVIAHAEKGETSGKEQLPERIEATKLNAQRMKRIYKQIEISNEIQAVLENINKRWTWIVLAESWCGDGAQNIPIIAKIAECSPDIELKIILRDENPEIMDAYLTNGSSSIPKLVCINLETKEEIGTWGPRPVIIQNMVKQYRSENPNVPHDEFVKNLHLWYAKDKGESLQKNLETLLRQWTIC